MKLPSIQEEFHMDIPDRMIISLFKFKDRTFVRTNSNLTMLSVEEVNGREWILMDGNKLLRYNGPLLKEEIVTDKDTIDFIQIEDQIKQVKSAGKSFIIEGDPYSYFLRKFDVVIFLNQRELFLNFNGKIYSFERPQYFLLTTKVLSMLYPDHNISFDFISSEKKVFDDQLIHLSLRNDLAVDMKGRIYIDDNLVGVCKREYVDYIGRLNGNRIILCGDEIKEYSNGAWYNLGISSSPYNVKANGELLGYLNNNIVNIFNINHDKISEFKDMKSLEISYRHVFLITKDNWYGVLDLFSTKDMNVISSKVTSSSGVILSNVDTLHSKVIPDNGRIRSYDSSKGLMEIDPISFDSNIKLKITSNFYTKTIELPINIEKPSFSLVKPVIVIAPKDFHYKEDPKCNAYMKAQLNYSSPIDTQLRVNIGNVSKFISIKKGKFSERIMVPLNIDKAEQEVITLCLGNTICKEYVVPVKLVGEDTLKRTRTKHVMNSIVEIKDVYVIDKFEKSEVVQRYVEPYKSVTRAKLGDSVKIEDKLIRVELPVQVIKIEKDNISREYLIQGVENPLTNFSVFLEGNYLSLHIEFKRSIGLEIIYGNEDWRNFIDGVVEVRFSLKPECNTVILRIYDGNLLWLINYRVDIELSKVLKLAYDSSLRLKEQLESFGVL